jgi:hypothetical protein
MKVGDPAVLGQVAALLWAERVREGIRHPRLDTLCPTSTGGSSGRKGALTLPDAAPAAARSRARARGRGVAPEAGPPTQDAVSNAWADWLAGVPWSLQLHANAREPLGEGSWRYFLRTACQMLGKRSGLNVVAFACTQTNADRPRLHVHSIIAGVPWQRRLVGYEECRDQLLAVPRWTGQRPVGPQLVELIAKLHPYTRHHAQQDNAGAVRLAVVQPRGNANDSASLIRYVARYMLRVDAGDWLEIGDLRAAGLAPAA